MWTNKDWKRAKTLKKSHALLQFNILKSKIFQKLSYTVTVQHFEQQTLSKMSCIVTIQLWTFWRAKSFKNCHTFLQYNILFSYLLHIIIYMNKLLAVNLSRHWLTFNLYRKLACSFALLPNNRNYFDVYICVFLYRLYIIRLF